jgi:hypothetical protein
MATTVSHEEEGNPTLARLLPVIRGDRALGNVLADGKLWVGAQRLEPSGLDLVACAVARSVLPSPTGKVALALPRGLEPLPVLIGLYLAVNRVVLGRLTGRLSGSVAISTRRTELRDLASGLLFDGSELEDAIPVARLVTEPLPNRRVRAAAIELRDRSKRKGLSQDDAYLLFQLPNRAPPVALNVIFAMVVDTVGSSVESWELTYEHNVAAKRRQVWLGELGDSEYERFCEEHHIPLMRLDWPLIAAAADAAGVGRSALASTGASARALQMPTPGYHLVASPDVDDELREVNYRLIEMRKRGGPDAPEPVKYAGQLVGLLTRLACPIPYYDRAVASFPMSRRVQWLLERVLEASSSGFRNRWKLAFEQHWTGVKGALKELVRLLSDPEDCPKFWGVQERLTALGRGQKLRVLVQTRAERAALREALLADGLITEQDFGKVIEVAAFGERAPQGPADARVVTLLCSPPPPQRAAVYLSGEAGQVEVLCYPFELPRLKSHLARSWSDYAGEEHNEKVLDVVHVGSPTRRRAAGGAERSRRNGRPGVQELDSYGSGNGLPATEEQPALPKLPAPDADFWAHAAELYDQHLESGPDHDDDERQPDAAGGGDDYGYSGFARLVTFSDGPPMYLREDAACTVVVPPAGPGEEPDVVTLPPAELRRGMRIALLPGSERGGLLAELMAAWDQGLETVRLRYETLYRRALGAALARHGIDLLAFLVGLTPAAVRLWMNGYTWPGTAATLLKLLEASGDEEALANQTLIQAYFSRVRTAHRYIGRVLNEAVGETVLYGAVGGESIGKLQALVGYDLTDIFDATSVLTVESVSERREVPAGVCGNFLDPDDPYLKAKGVLIP